MLAVTHTLNANIVNDFRFGFRDWTNRDTATTNQQCGGSGCFGGPVPGIAPNGLPNLSMIGSANFGAGSYSLSPQRRLSRNFEPKDTVSWLKGSHRLQFGFDFDYDNDLSITRSASAVA